MAPPKVNNLYPTCDPRYMQGLTDPASQPPRDEQGLAAWAQQQYQRSFGVCRDPKRNAFQVYPVLGSVPSPMVGVNPLSAPTTPPTAFPMLPQQPLPVQQPPAASGNWFEEQAKNPVAWGILIGAKLLIGTAIVIARRRRNKAAAPQPQPEPQPELEPVVLPPVAAPEPKTVQLQKPLPPVTAPEPKTIQLQKPLPPVAPPPLPKPVQLQKPATVDVDKTPLATSGMPSVTTGISEVLESLVRLHNRELMNVPEYRIGLPEEGKMRILRAIAEGRFLTMGEVAINPLGRDRVRVKTSGQAYDLAFDRKADPSAAEKMNAEYLGAVEQLRGLKAMNPEAWAQELIVRRSLYGDAEWKYGVLARFGYDPAKPLPAGDGPLPRKWVETFPISSREPEGGAIFDATRTRVQEATRDPEEAIRTRYDDPLPKPAPAPKRGFFGKVFGGIADTFRGVGRFFANLFTRKPAVKALPPAAEPPIVALKDVLPSVIVNEDERLTLVQEDNGRRTIAIDQNELRIAISRAIQWHTMELTQEQRGQFAPFIRRTEQYLEQHQVGIDSPARTGLARWLVWKIESDSSLSTLGTVGDIPKEAMEKLLAEAGIAMELRRGMPWKAEPSAPAATIPEIDPEVKGIIDDLRAAEPEAFRGIADEDLKGLAEGIREMRAAGAFEGMIENGRIKSDALRMAARMAKARAAAGRGGAAEAERRDKEAREAKKGPAEVLKK